MIAGELFSENLVTWQSQASSLYATLSGTSAGCSLAHGVEWYRSFHQALYEIRSKQIRKVSDSVFNQCAHKHTVCSGSSAGSAWLVYMSGSWPGLVRTRRASKQLCGNTDSPARGLNSALPPPPPPPPQLADGGEKGGWGWGGERGGFYFSNTFIVTAQNKTQLKQTSPRKASPQSRGINFTSRTQESLRKRNRSERKTDRQKAVSLMWSDPWETAGPS